MNLNYVSPEDFQRFRFAEKKKSSGSCGMILIIVVIIVVAMLSKCSPPHHMSEMVSGLKTKIESKIMPQLRHFGRSAKIAETVTTDDAYVKNPMNNVLNLTPCEAGDALCANFKQVDSTYKSKTTESAMKLLKQHPDSIVMCYAPWCPHCHNAVPEYCEASKGVKDKCLLINAEMVDQSVLKMLNVTHFPFIAKRHGGKQEVFKGPPVQKHIHEFIVTTM